MCPCGEEEETTDHLIFQCNKLSNQRNEMIEQIQNTCGTWPPTPEKLVNEYLKPFVKFIKSIDFTDLQRHVNIKNRSWRMYVNTTNVC
jgi:hypothetical protein